MFISYYYLLYYDFNEIYIVLFMKVHYVININYARI
jgi:hypothetical protein